MSESVDITDRESLEAWLEDQPREVVVWIASRAAARVLPVFWEDVITSDWARRRNVTALLVLRSLLLSSVASNARDAANTRNAVRAAAPAVRAAARAARTAALAAAARAPDNTVHAATAATAATAALAALAAEDAWEAFRADAWRVRDGTVPGALPLWPKGRGPLEETWKTIIWQVITSEDAEDWQFWTYWYDSLLDGRPMLGDAGRTWEMLGQIALIDPATWDKGPEAVNPVIREIYEGYLVEDVIAQHPLALRITRNEKSGKLQCGPQEVRDLEEIVSGIRQALREFTARCRNTKGTDLGSVLLNAFERPIKELRRDIGKYRQDPRQLFRVLEETRREMRLIAQEEGVARDSAVDRLLGNLEQQGEDICVAAPEVLEEVKKRVSVRVQLFTAEQSIAAMRMTGGMIVDSDGLLRSAAAQALLVIMDEARSEADKQAAWTFILGALPRGARALRADGEDGSKPSDDPSLLDTVVGYADKASKIDRGVDALQEAVAEGGPWGARVYSEIVSGNLWGLGG